jgi:hypothetical protein
MRIRVSECNSCLQDDYIEGVTIIPRVGEKIYSQNRRFIVIDIVYNYSASEISIDVVQV